jgi:hypothetical protein
MSTIEAPSATSWVTCVCRKTSGETPSTPEALATRRVVAVRFRTGRRARRPCLGTQGPCRVAAASPRDGAGFLDAHRDTFKDFDLIIPSPAFIDDDGRTTTPRPWWQGSLELSR